MEIKRNDRGYYVFTPNEKELEIIKKTTNEIVGIAVKNALTTEEMIYMFTKIRNASIDYYNIWLKENSENSTPSEKIYPDKKKKIVKSKKRLKNKPAVVGEDVE